MNYILKCKVLVALIVLMGTALHSSINAQHSEAKNAFTRDGWLTELSEAKKVAEKEGKDLLIEFRLSTGCGWCIKLEKEVLSQAEFKANIPTRFTMVVLNIPRDFTGLSSEKKQEYEALIEQYQVNSFPCLVCTDAGGRPYKSMSYRDGRNKGFLEKLMSVHTLRENRDQAFLEAQKVEGVLKARLLEQGLSEVSSKYYKEYTAVIEAIEKSDSSDTSGFISNLRINKVKYEMGRLLAPRFSARKFSEIPVIIDGYIQENELKEGALQVAMLYQVRALYMDEQYDRARAVADEIIEINDVSCSARYAEIIKKRIKHISEEVE